MLLHSSSAGYLYCNLPGLEAPRGSNVRFVLIGMGSEADLHSPAFAGQVRTWHTGGRCFLGVQRQLAGPPGLLPATRAG